MVNFFLNSFPDDVPAVLCHATLVYRLLYDIAMDLFDKQSSSGVLNIKSPSLSRQTSMEPPVSIHYFFV